MTLSHVYKIRDNAILPTQQNPTDVGYDICAVDDYIIKLNDFVTIKTGISVKPPDGMYFEIALRSSLPSKYGLLIPNGVGIIDPSYAGKTDEVGVLVYKFRRGKLDIDQGDGPVTVIKAGTRIAQLILRPAIYTSFEESAPVLIDRGGFGSTGEI